MELGQLLKGNELTKAIAEKTEQLETLSRYLTSESIMGARLVLSYHVYDDGDEHLAKEHIDLIVSMVVLLRNQLAADLVQLKEEFKNL